MDSPETRARWAAELTARARTHWTAARTADLARGKSLRLPPADAAPLLRALGLLRADASMPPAQVRKYFQINHMVTVLEPALRELRAHHPTIRILDAGCGRSYLTLLLAWCARHTWHHRLEVLGVDRNAAVIDECRRRTELADLGDLVRFEAAPLDTLDISAAWRRAFGETGTVGVAGSTGDAAPTRDARPTHDAGPTHDADPTGAGPVHAVIALHACDTATCDALALGVALHADLIAVAPCCQAELARAWTALDARGAAGAFAPIWGAPHLRRETAAHLTDAMRTLLLRSAGYDVSALEFVPAEHTPKNTMLRAIKRHAADPAARTAYDALCAATGGAGLALADRLDGHQFTHQIRWCSI
jgi:SAM-dependent methyltransferase